MDNNLHHGGNGGGAGGGVVVPSSPSSGGGGGGGDRFSDDISQMSELPAKNLLGHRRAHSEIISLPDDLSFDSDLGVVGGGLGGDGNGGGGPSLSDEADEDFVSMYMDMEKFGPSSSSDTSGAVAGEPSSSSFLPPPVSGEPSSADGVSNRPRIRHHYSQSMDGSSSIKPELLSEGPSLCQDHRRVSSAKLAELALVDPKRAKRIWQNRQSAARSKERKMRYISELERKLQTLQTEATTLSTQLNMLQRDRSGLTSENNELKVRLHNIEQKLHLQDALNEALKDEVHRLKLMTGQTIVGSMPMQASSQPFYPNNNHVAMNSLLAAHQLQQLQVHQQQQQ